MMNMSMHLSICTKKSRGVSYNFCGQKVFKVLKFTHIYVLKMGAVHCHAGVYISG